MIEYQVMSGLHGTRQLARAYAEVLLRKKGCLPKIKPPVHGKQKLWTDSEFDEAQAMRLRNMTDDAIAAKLGRGRQAVFNRLGPRP